MDISFLFSLSTPKKSTGYVVGFINTPATVWKIKKSAERNKYMPNTYHLKYKGEIITMLSDETIIDLQKGDIIEIISF